MVKEGKNNSEGQVNALLMAGKLGEAKKRLGQLAISNAISLINIILLNFPANYSLYKDGKRCFEFLLEFVKKKGI